MRIVIAAIAAVFIAGMLAQFVLSGMGSEPAHYALAAGFVMFTIIVAVHTHHAMSHDETER